MVILISKWYNKNGRKLKIRKGVSLPMVLGARLRKPYQDALDAEKMLRL